MTASIKTPKLCQSFKVTGLKPIYIKNSYIGLDSLKNMSIFSDGLKEFQTNLQSMSDLTRTLSYNVNSIFLNSMKQFANNLETPLHKAAKQQQSIINQALTSLARSCLTLPSSIGTIALASEIRGILAIALEFSTTYCVDSKYSNVIGELDTEIHDLENGEKISLSKIVYIVSFIITLLTFISGLLPNPQLVELSHKLDKVIEIESQILEIQTQQLSETKQQTELMQDAESSGNT